MKLDEINDAQRHLTQAEAILSTKLGDNADETISIRIYTANLFCIERDFDAALPILLKAVDQLKNTSSGSRLHLNSRILLAKVHVEKGDLQAGEEILVEIIAATNAKDLQKEWIVAQGTLAKVYRLKGDLERARAILDVALSAAREHDPTGLDTAGLLHESALLALASGDQISAARDVEEAILIASAKLKPTHRNVVEYNQTKNTIHAR
jgi:ATP/maltotriose-dependent transcriptional regulator MalT